MAETPKTEPKRKADEPAAPKARAAESSDPAVHKLLADIQTAAANGDDDGVKAASDELAKLGYDA